MLIDLPVDILLCLFQFLEVEDAISFSVVSRSVQDLFRTHERTCLISTLDKTRLTRPIPCPPSEDITTAKYDVEALRGLVQHFSRLNWNWRNDKPQIIGPVRNLTVDKHLDTLAQIPGTSYVITHSILKSRLSVWSTEDGRRVCSVSCHKRVLDLSTGWSERNKFIIALLTNPNYSTFPNSIQVLTVDYSGPEVMLDISLSKRLELADVRYFQAVFLNAEVVGVLYMNHSQSHDVPSPLHVIAYNRITNRETDICVCQELSSDEVRMIWQSGHTGTSFWNDNLYIHSEHNLVVYQLWIPRHLLPYDNVANVPARTCYNAIPIPPVQHPIGMRYKGPTWQVQLEAILTTQSTFGAIALTIYIVSNHSGAMPLTVVNYWIVDAISSTVTDEAIRLPVPTLHPCIAIPGSISASWLSAWYLCQSTNCGTYLILLSDETGEIKIRLLRLKLPDYHFTVHTLEPPPFVKPHLVSGFFVDEYRGTVTLYQGEGEMFVCEFA
ncbi:hypothetical protein AX15_003378 [Amanita polypyramis BW_CC]|nr:hypothetical protein AX15_003378 [Amanita polypyramis BW_CC]